MASSAGSSDGARAMTPLSCLLEEWSPDCKDCILDIDPAIEPQLFRPGRSLQCEQCGSPHQAAKMLLCDGCNTGWHTHCVGLLAVPAGQWFCKECEAFIKQPLAARSPSQDAAPAAPAAPAAVAPGSRAVPAPAAQPPTPGTEQRRSQRLSAAAQRSNDLGNLLFPQAATRRRDEAAAGLHGRMVSRPASRRGGSAAAGVLEYLGALARPRYFLVRWSDGEEQEVTLAQARKMLVE